MSRVRVLGEVGNRDSGDLFFACAGEGYFQIDEFAGQFLNIDRVVIVIQPVADAMDAHRNEVWNICFWNNHKMFNSFWVHICSCRFIVLCSAVYTCASKGIVSGIREFRQLLGCSSQCGAKMTISGLFPVGGMPLNRGEIVSVLHPDFINTVLITMA